MEKQKNRIGFWFTRDSFQLDETLMQTEEGVSEGAEAFREKFYQDKYLALYEMGFAQRSPELDASGIFLYQIADCFSHALTSQPDIELTREQAEITVEDSAIDGLLQSVPFVSGSEFVTREWLERQF